MRKIPTKNYIILAIILIFTAFLVFYLRGWYNTTKEYYASNSIIKDVVREINENEIYSYTTENQKFILYVSSGVNGDVKSFEENLKSLIEKLDISEDVIYLNIDNVDKANFYENLKNRFALNEIKSEITDSSSSVYVFENGKIVSALNNCNNKSIKQIESYLKKWERKND